MKVSILLFFVIIHFFTCFSLLYSQNASPSIYTDWEIVSKAENDVEDTIELSVKAFFPKKFYAYTDKSNIEDIPPILFEFDNLTSKDFIVIEEKLSYHKIEDPLFEKKQVSVLFGENIWKIKIFNKVKQLQVLKGKVLYNISDGKSFYAEEFPFFKKLASPSKGGVNMQLKRENIDIHNPKTVFSQSGASYESDTQKSSLWSIFLMGMLGGLIALLTPCVFPMVPLTVSFFTKQSKNRKQGIRNSIFYAFSILFIYTILSLPFHFLDSVNPEILNNISTNWILNMVFFIVFLVFAFSFFGYYEITLPSHLMTNVDRKSSMGSITGIFFMALTLAIVSFSCTGPILGTLLVGSLSSNSGAWQLTFGMSGFGLALALPFGLLALFPHWLQRLPKSGSWLEVVKITFGFLELALAFKFLSNADLVQHWGLLKREIFLGIWIVIGLLFILYIMGFLRFPHQSAFKKYGGGRITLLIVVFICTLYLILGLTTKRFANMSIISGFPPPMFYSIFVQKSECALNLSCEKDYFKALLRAKEENKPLLLDFTGWACVNCRKMEENVWIVPDIYNLINEKFILVSLYVDDRKELPVEEQFQFRDTLNNTSTFIETVGDKWSKFETLNFQNNSQPLYAIISPEEELLISPVAYFPDKEGYKKWLQQGLETFRELK